MSRRLLCRGLVKWKWIQFFYLCNFLPERCDLWRALSIMLQQFATGQKGPVRFYERGSEEKLPCLQSRIEPRLFSPQSVIVLHCVTSRHCAMFWCRLCQCQYGVFDGIVYTRYYCVSQTGRPVAGSESNSLPLVWLDPVVSIHSPMPKLSTNNVGELLLKFH